MIVLVFVVRVIAMMSPGDSWVARWQRIGMLGDIVGHHHTPYQYSTGVSQQKIVTGLEVQSGYASLLPA